MSFLPFTASHNELATPCCASQRLPSAIPTLFNCPPTAASATINLPFIPSSLWPALSQLCNSLLFHLIHHAVNLPHFPSDCFKTYYLCPYGEKTGLYRLALSRQQVFLLPMSRRTDIPSLFHKVHVLLQQSCTHPYLMLQQRKMSRN